MNGRLRALWEYLPTEASTVVGIAPVIVLILRFDVSGTIVACGALASAAGAVGMKLPP